MVTLICIVLVCSLVLAAIAIVTDGAVPATHRPAMPIIASATPYRDRAARTVAPVIGLWTAELWGSLYGPGRPASRPEARVVPRSRTLPMPPREDRALVDSDYMRAVRSARQATRTGRVVGPMRTGNRLYVQANRAPQLARQVYCPAAPAWTLGLPRDHARRVNDERGYITALWRADRLTDEQAEALYATL